MKIEYVLLIGAAVALYLLAKRGACPIRATEPGPYVPPDP